MKKESMRIGPVIAALLLASACGGTSAGSDPESDEWLQRAELGEYAPESQDWAEIEAAAQEEGSVNVYSVSSRMQEFGDAFEAKYGIEVTFAELPSSEQTVRFAREHAAGIHDVDVLYNNDPSTMVTSFLPKGMVHNFVPDDVRDKLAEADRDPLLIQRWTGRVFIYNTAVNTTSPIDNIWDLTRPEWKGRFQMPDPATDGAQAETIMTILQHSDAVARAYEEEFGEELTEFSEAVQDATGQNKAYREPNAAIEWLYQVLQNEPVFVQSTTDISDQVGDVTSANPPVGMTTYSKIRTTEPGAVEWQPAFDLKPAVGVFYANVLAIADRAPHPNAAKLVIREMMIAEGFEPWNEPGDYATNTDLQEAQAAEFGETVLEYDDLEKYTVDHEYVFSHRKGFLQLYLAL